MSKLKRFWIINLRYERKSLAVPRSPSRGPAIYVFLVYMFKSPLLNSREWCSIALFFPTAMLQLVNTIERIAQFGLVVAPSEMNVNQQEIPAESDIWSVIMSFKDSFRLLFGYLRNNLNALVEDIELGSLSIAVTCSSLEILEGLWEDYISGHLNQVVQETLVTHEVLEILGLKELKLKVFISDEKYHNGKLILRKIPVSILLF